MNIYDAYMALHHGKRVRSASGREAVLLSGEVRWADGLRGPIRIVGSIIEGWELIEPEPEYEDVVVRPHKATGRLQYERDPRCFTLLTDAPNDPDFAGYIYPFTQYPEERPRICPGGGKEPAAKPTHVRFRRRT